MRHVDDRDDADDADRGEYRLHNASGDVSERDGFTLPPDERIDNDRSRDLCDDETELKIVPNFRLVMEVAPGMKRMSVHSAPVPCTKRIRAGMLVMNVPMKNQPKIRPVR